MECVVEVDGEHWPLELNGYSSRALSRAQRNLVSIALQVDVILVLVTLICYGIRRLVHQANSCTPATLLILVKINDSGFCDLFNFILYLVKVMWFIKNPHQARLGLLKIS